MKPKRLKTITTKTTETQPIDERNPLNAQIKSFFDTGIITEDMAALSYRIRVMKFHQPTGRFVSLTGTQYTELDSLENTLVRQFGNARFRLYVNGFNEEGHHVATVILPDWAIEATPDMQLEPEYVEIDEKDSREIRPGTPSVTDVLLAQMQMMNELLKTMVMKQNAPAPGTTTADMIELIKLGVGMGAGGAGGEQPDMFERLLSGPLGAALMARMGGPLKQEPPAPVRPENGEIAAPRAVQSDA